MAVIVLEFASIAGESVVSGYENQVDAVSIQEYLEVPASKSGGRVRGARTVGQSQYSDIGLVRMKDCASPKLAEACSSGTNLGAVKVTLFRTLEAGLVPYLTYEMTNVFVSRIEHETLDGEGAAFAPHLGEAIAIDIAPPARHGPSGAGSKPPSRPMVRPVAPVITRTYSNQEVERLHLNPGTAVWNYTQFDNGRQVGQVAKGWNIQKSVEGDDFSEYL